MRRFKAIAVFVVGSFLMPLPVVSYTLTDECCRVIDWNFTWQLRLLLYVMLLLLLLFNYYC